MRARARTHTHTHTRILEGMQCHIRKCLYTHSLIWMSLIAGLKTGTELWNGIWKGVYGMDGECTQTCVTGTAQSRFSYLP